MSDPTEILYTPEIFSYQQVGGVSRYFVELANGLRALGQRPRLLAGLHCNEYVHSLGPPATGAYLPFRFGRLAIPFLWFNRPFCRLAASFHPRAIVHQTYYGPTAYLGSRPLVVTVYDLIHEIFADRLPGLKNPSDPTRRYKQASCLRADHIIAISESTKADLVRLFGIDPAKITAIHLADSLARFEAPAAGQAPPPEREYLLYVGSRTGYKNFDALLEAFGRSTALRRRFQLVCFGGGAFSSAEHQRIAVLGIADRVVHRSGDDAALARCYRQATAFVYPSLYEGFGLPLLEAMGQDCPVLCGDGGSMTEVAGDAAAYFDPSSRESIQAVLEETTADESRLAALRISGRGRARLFSWERCARETLEVYRRLAA